MQQSAPDTLSSVTTENLLQNSVLNLALSNPSALLNHEIKEEAWAVLVWDVIYNSSSNRSLPLTHPYFSEHGLVFSYLFSAF